jgi:maltoporin
MLALALAAAPAAAGAQGVEDAGEDAAGRPVEDRFWLGSYGRAVASSDLDGGRGRPSQVVAFGPRLTEGSYVELDLGFRALRDETAHVDAVVTFAFADELFHATGEFDSRIALRQAYVEARDIEGSGAFVWAGSRMYRGDTIYLFDFWPLDELNTVGGGAGLRGDDWELALQGGLSRLEDEFQVQRVPVPAPDTFAEDVLFLDRQRAVFSVKGEQRFGGRGDEPGFKVRLYGEGHHLPAGRRALPGSFTETEPLPDDQGFLAGAQLGAWNLGPAQFVNLWLSAATGLAAYGEFQRPYGLNADRRAVDAREYRVAVDTNLQAGDVSVLLAGWARAFNDADGEDEDFDDRVEAAAAVRPTWFVNRWFTPAVEASYQVSRPNGLNPRTLNQDAATVAQIGFIPALTFSAAGQGPFARPQIRLIYAVSFLNDAALALYPADDPRAGQDVVQFLGVGAEWWFGRGGGY